MDIEKALNQFLNEQRIKYPLLTQWDEQSLSLGFVSGAEYAIKQEMEAMK